LYKKQVFNFGGFMIKAPTPEMAQFRADIDALDDQIISLLGQRFDIVRNVAAHKKQHGIATVLADRVEEVKENAARIGSDHNLDPEFMRNLYALIIEHACACEDVIVED